MFRTYINLFLFFVSLNSAHADLIDDPDGILGTLHINGATTNSFDAAPVFLGTGPEFSYEDTIFSVSVDIIDHTLWITQTQLEPGALPWEIWLEDLSWGVPGRITDILVPTMPPFSTTFTGNSIHIRYDPVTPPDPGTTIEYHTDFEVRHIPEPSSLLLGLFGIGLLAATRKR